MMTILSVTTGITSGEQQRRPVPSPKQYDYIAMLPLEAKLAQEGLVSSIPTSLPFLPHVKIHCPLRRINLPVQGITD